MKKFLLYACVALLSCIAFAQTNVVVVLKEGVKKIYEAAAVDSIRINKNEGYDAVVVLKNGKEEKYAVKDIDSIKIEKDAPVPAEETGLLFSYYEESNTASVRGIKNYDDASEIKIPSQVVYEGVIYDVTSIKLNAFAYAKYSSIEIPESVTIIGDEAFVYCVNLTSIEIPSSVTKIGRSAFADCQKLKTARVPVGCELGNNAFPSSCVIEWYDPLTGEKIIPAEESFLTFEYDETTMTASVTGVENKELTFIKIGIPSKVLNDGKVYVVTSIGSEAFLYCINLTSIEIPNSVTSIGDVAFGGCPNLSSIVIPNSVTSIGSEAFVACESLESIEIPESIDAIGSSLFYRCENLKTARVPVSLKGKVESAFPETCEIVWYASAEISGLKFEYDDATMTASVTGVENEEATFVEIPSVVLYEGKEYDVTSIGGYAFAKCKNLASIEIPELVTSIGDRAFAGCVALTSIKIPSSVTSINESAFMHCVGLTGIEVDKDNKVYDSRENCNAIIETTSNTLIAGCQNTVIPESVTSIGGYAFSGCDNLTKIEIPNSITSIGVYAFMACYNLTDIVIPESVTSIGEVAFYDCINLKTARVPVSLKGKVESAFPTTCKINWYDPSTGEIVIFAEETDLKFSYNDEFNTASVSGIKNYDDASEIKIPSQVVYNGVIYDVTSIKFNAFTYASYSSIEIPNSVTSIAEQSFLYCVNLTSIEIPSSVKKIGSSAFANCLNLKTARVPVGCELGNNAFPSTCEIVWYDPLTSFTFGFDETAKTAIVTGFENKEATFVEIPSVVLQNDKEYDITTIGENAFLAASSLTSIIIPNSVTSIGNQAFALCASLTSIEIPNSVTSIGERAFTLTPLTSIVIPESVTSIGENAFFLCPYLETARVPVSLKGKVESAFPETCEIVWYASAGNSGLKFLYDKTAMTARVNGVKNEDITEVIIPSHVLYVGNVYDVTSIGEKAFNNCTSLTSIEIPSSITSIGMTAFYGCTSLTSIEIPESVTAIGSQTFSGCTSLTSIEIPNSVTEIGSMAFYGCTSLTSIEIPESVTSIQYDTFWGCKNLTSIEIPESVTEIRGGAFGYCTSLTSIEIPNSVTSIGEIAFRNCTSLTSIEIPNSVTTIGYCTFENCTSLTSIEIPNSVTTIGDHAFFDCSSLKSIEIPESVTTIEKYAFAGCKSLTSIEIPNSVTEIGEGAFAVCESLTSIVIPNSVTKIGKDAFRDCKNLKTARVPVSLKGMVELAFPSTCKIEWY